MMIREMHEARKTSVERRLVNAVRFNASNGKWGYHPLVVSLANTQEVLGIFNGPGNGASQQRSVWLIERSIGLYRRAGVRRILLRGDSKFSQTEHFFTNDSESSASEIVFSCNDRCNQEKLIEQLKNGVRALRAPVDKLLSNWAYMAMTALAWNLKAWAALWLPETARRVEAAFRRSNPCLFWD
jgi:hypothetical protein